MNARLFIAERQKTALANPCQFAQQCAQPRYRFVMSPMKGVRCTAVLTVNIGEE